MKKYKNFSITLMVLSLSIIFVGCMMSQGENNPQILTDTTHASFTLPKSTQTKSMPPTAFLSKTPVSLMTAENEQPSSMSMESTSVQTTHTSQVPQTPAQLGAAVPNSEGSINLGNLSDLKNVAQWGYGSILGLAYSPTGDIFVVGSAFGYAIYHTDLKNQPPEWIKFEKPFVYENIFFSEDGNYILFEIENIQKVVERRTGTWLKDIEKNNWIRPVGVTTYSTEFSHDSLDGSLRFISSRGYIIFEEPYFEKEISVREIFKIESGEQLLSLSDVTEEVGVFADRYNDGCNISMLSNCGNAYMGTISYPVRVGFSPDNKTITIVYQPVGREDENYFGYAVTYSLEFGNVLARFGDPIDPVEYFSYSPDGKQILLGFVNGTIQIWDLPKLELIYSAWHFNAPVINLKYSSDGKYIVVGRANDIIEVRVANTGSLINRFYANVFAVSPVENLVALGFNNGEIKTFDLSTFDIRASFQAHHGSILALAFSSDGLELASSGLDCTVRSWNVKTSQLIRLYEESYTNIAPIYEFFYDPGTESYEKILIHALSFSPNDKQLIGYGSWSSVANWDRYTGTTNFVITPEYPYMTINRIWNVPDYSTVFRINSVNQNIFLDQSYYDISSGEKINEDSIKEKLPDECFEYGIYSKNGQLFFSKAFNDHRGKICVINTETAELEGLLETFDLQFSERIQIEWLYLSPDEAQLIASLTGGILLVYQTQTGNN